MARLFPKWSDFISPLKSHSLSSLSFLTFPLYLCLFGPKNWNQKHLRRINEHLAAMHMLRFRGSASKERDSSPRTDQSSPSASSTLLFSSSSPPSSFGPSSNGGSPALGRPLRLVYCDGRGKFHLDPEAVGALQLVKGPVGVVSVCGRARQGKSFILNQVSLSILPYNVLLTQHVCSTFLFVVLCSVLSELACSSFLLITESN